MRKPPFPKLGRTPHAMSATRPPRLVLLRAAEGSVSGVSLMQLVAITSWPRARWPQSRVGGTFGFAAAGRSRGRESSAWSVSS